MVSNTGLTRSQRMIGTESAVPPVGVKGEPFEIDPALGVDAARVR